VSAATPTARRAAEGQLDLLLAPGDGATRLHRNLAVPPLQLSRLRYDDPAHPAQANLTMVHLGGILAGDRLHIRVELRAGAEASISSAAATQVYCMSDRDASQEIRLRLGPGSRLLWLPEPLILFAGACFRQDLRAELAPGARLALLDVVVPGRLARGEVFQFTRFESRLEICDQAGECLAAERACIEPGHSDPATAGLFGATPVLGSLYLLGDSLDAEALCAQAAQLCADDGGAAVLPNGSGVLIRTLGDSASGVRSRLITIWRALATEFDQR
jgi:urease accessory protein